MLARGGLILLLTLGAVSSISPEREGRLQASLRYREGLLACVRYVKATPALFPEAKLKEARALSRAEREAAWAVWKTYLDYALALDSLAKASQRYGGLAGGEREAALLTLAVSTLGPYRAALELLERLGNDPAFDKLLDEEVPELGLPRGSYARFKLRYLNVLRAAELAALTVALKSGGGSAFPEARAAVQADSDLLWKMGKGTGEAMTLENAVAVVRGTGFAAWLPVQAGVAEWMGDTKVWRRHRTLISREQASALSGRLRPGDILIERREWYLSNVGLPGYWPHAALYTGTPGERRAFFGGDPAVRAWLASEGRTDDDLEALYLAREPGAYRAAVTRIDGEEPRVIEAVSEGVVFTTLSHSAAADALAVLRPRLPKVEVARALLRAFRYHGRPYDFNFDFATDDAVVCSELVVKAYPEGLDFPVVEILGRKATPPNQLVKRFDETYGTPAQRLELVAFLDGDERKRTAAEATLDEFRRSWRRPKWHILVAP